MTKPTKEDKLNIISWEVMWHEWSGMQQVMIGDCLKWIQEHPNNWKIICENCGKICNEEYWEAWCENDDCDNPLPYDWRANTYDIIENWTDYDLPIDDNKIAIDMMYDLIVNYKNGSETTPTEA